MSSPTHFRVYARTDFVADPVLVSQTRSAARAGRLATDLTRYGLASSVKIVAGWRYVDRLSMVARLLLAAVAAHKAGLVDD